MNQCLTYWHYDRGGEAKGHHHGEYHKMPGILHSIHEFIITSLRRVEGQERGGRREGGRERGKEGGRREGREGAREGEK